MTEENILQSMEQNFSKIFTGTSHEVVLGSTSKRDKNIKDVLSEGGAWYVDTKGDFTEQEMHTIREK